MNKPGQSEPLQKELPLPTPREEEILQLVFQGKASAQIAAELGVTRRVIEFHLANLYRKWNVKSRLQSCQVGLRLGLLAHPEVDAGSAETREDI